MQRCIHGPAVNVPSNVDTICTCLPRLPSQSELIPLKFKRKLCYKGYYMYDYIRPNVVFSALQWLKNNNPLYKDIEINTSWMLDALNDNQEMLSYMVPGHPMPLSSISVNPNSSDNSIATAMDTLHTVAIAHGFTVHDVGRDGNCLFNK